MKQSRLLRFHFKVNLGRIKQGHLLCDQTASA